MTNDRSYWRSESDKRLIEEAMHSGDELCIALGERLEALADLEDQFGDLKHELQQAQTRIRMLQEELDDIDGREP